MGPGARSNKDRPQDAASRNAAFAILLGVGLLVAAFSYGLYAIASQIDSTARAKEERLVATGLALHAAETRHGLEGNTIWDDAVRHLDLAFDAGWARDYIGQYFWRSGGYQLVYVLDADGRAEFAYNRGRVVERSTFSPLAAAAAPLVAEIRAKERARGPARADDATPSSAIDASSIGVAGGQTYLISASLIQTDHSGHLQPDQRAPIVLVGEAVDGRFLDKLAKSYLLADPRVAPASGPMIQGYDSAPVRDLRGRTVIRIAWRPDSPVAHLVSLAGPSLAVAFLGLIGVATVLLRRERRRNVALERATQEAQSASSAKSAFLATMSHEIRTPLNGVLGMAQAMAAEPLSGTQRARLDVVRQSGEALLAILNDVLDLAKIESGKLELEAVEFELGDVMETVRAAFTALSHGKDLSLALEFADAEGVYLGDPNRIRQILFNLVSNAVKFTAAGAVRVRAEATDDGLRLSVSDTGEGIAADKLASLFDKFTQADASTTRRFGGTGLGLAICRDLAQVMDGGIDATSEPGVGSTFVVTLKLPRVGDSRKLARRAAPATTAEPPGPLDMRVLVAEDNEVNQLVIKTLLRQLGLEPTIVDNGQRAVEAWERDDWDLILMDVQMPVMDGLAATRAIRTLEGAEGRQRTPIVALTADAMNHQTSQYAAVGMDDLLAKPIEVRALVEILTRFLEPRSPETISAPRRAAASRV